MMKVQSSKLKVKKILDIRYWIVNATAKQEGQALITLLFFMIIGITLIVAASIVTLQNVASTSSAEQGTIAYFNAESGMEDALVQLLRYPCSSSTPYPGCTSAYTSGNATVQVSVSGSTITVTSSGTFQNAIRKIQVIETYGSNGWAVTSWQEIN